MTAKAAEHSAAFVRGSEETSGSGLHMQVGTTAQNVRNADVLR